VNLKVGGDLVACGRLAVADALASASQQASRLAELVNLQSSGDERLGLRPVPFDFVSQFQQQIAYRRGVLASRLAAKVTLQR
jgi:hypothetical protein